MAEIVKAVFRLKRSSASMQWLSKCFNIASHAPLEFGSKLCIHACIPGYIDEQGGQGPDMHRS